VYALDHGTRRRLTARFGAPVEPWLDEMPSVLAELAQRWSLELGATIPLGSMSVVLRCRTVKGGGAVLKVSFDRNRLAREAAALRRWPTPHVPSVLAADEGVGALLLEAIEPGTPLAESDAYPEPQRVAELLTALYESGRPDSAYPPLAARVAYLFDSGTKPYERRPELVEVVPPELYERGRLLAMRLAQEVSPTRLLHGDLNPGNVLDGGRRGLVAIDPAPCLGDDLAFEAVDIVYWQATRVDDVGARCEELAPLIGASAARLRDWCISFAAMGALEAAEGGIGPPERIDALIELAGRSVGAASG
jgi:streptomycin 6-kinase